MPFFNIQNNDSRPYRQGMDYIESNACVGQAYIIIVVPCEGISSDSYSIRIEADAKFVCKELPKEGSKMNRCIKNVICL
jgi:hypothetical protein